MVKRPTILLLMFFLLFNVIFSFRENATGDTLPEAHCKVRFDANTGKAFCEASGACICNPMPDLESSCCRFSDGIWKCGGTGNITSLRCRPCINSQISGCSQTSDYENKESNCVAKPESLGDSDEFPEPCKITLNDENPTLPPTCSGRCNPLSGRTACRMVPEHCCVGRSDVGHGEEGYNCGPGIACTCD